MNRKTYPQILDDVARGQIPANLNLAPKIIGEIQKGKDATMVPRMKVFITVIAVVLLMTVVLANVPDVRAAIQRWFGYISGVGLVSDGQIRVLAEPVSVTRDGVTITVKQVVLDAERTVLIYSVEGIPNQAYTTMPEEQCPYQAALRLPDGTVLSPGQGGGDASDTGYEHRFDYPAIPVVINDAELVISCLFQTKLGAEPENWEVPLHFMPAPPNLTAFPVIEITASTGAVSTHTPSESPDLDAGGISLKLDRAVLMDDGYLIYASVHWSDGNLYSLDVPDLPTTFHVVNGSGQEMLYELTYDEYTGMQPDQRQTVFAFKLDIAQDIEPLTLILDSVAVELPVEAYFVFDPGANPQPGQTWQLDQNIQVGEYTLRVVSASADSLGYTFEMVSDTGITFAALIDLDHPVIGGGGGGGSAESFSASIMYDGDLPAGPVVVTISSITVLQHGPWQVQWDPSATSLR